MATNIPRTACADGRGRGVVPEEPRHQQKTAEHRWLIKGPGFPDRCAITGARIVGYVPHRPIVRYHACHGQHREIADAPAGRHRLPEQTYYRCQSSSRTAGRSSPTCATRPGLWSAPGDCRQRDALKVVLNNLYNTPSWRTSPATCQPSWTACPHPCPWTLSPQFNHQRMLSSPYRYRRQAEAHPARPQALECPEFIFDSPLPTADEAHRSDGFLRIDGLRLRPSEHAAASPQALWSARRLRPPRRELIA